MTAARLILLALALTLTGCAGENLPFGTNEPPKPKAPQVALAGRWMLATPNAPACGMNFGSTPGAREGTIAPEGGCPGKFFMSRHWRLEAGVLTIDDHENRPLAQLKPVGSRFEGQSTAGSAVTLAR